MLTQKQWFTRGKSGWGIKPVSWQGWTLYGVVIVVMILALVVPQYSQYKDYVYVVGIFIMLDALSVLIPIKQDERDTQIEGVAERNAAWFMNIVLTFAVVYSAYHAVKFADMSLLNGFAFLALFGGALVKGFTHYFYDNQK